MKEPANEPAPAKDQHCAHPRRVHSRNGCGDFDLNTGQGCPCRTPYMEVGRR